MITKKVGWLVVDSDYYLMYNVLHVILIRGCFVFYFCRVFLYLISIVYSILVFYCWSSTEIICYQSSYLLR